MNQQNHLTKKEFEKTLYGALEDQAQSIIEAVNFGFEKAKEDRQEIKEKLSSLERRIIALEDMSTEHGKELRSIKKILAQLQKQRKVETAKIVLLETRIARIEVKAA